MAISTNQEHLDYKRMLPRTMDSEVTATRIGTTQVSSEISTTNKWKAAAIEARACYKLSKEFGTSSAERWKRFYQTDYLIKPWLNFNEAYIGVMTIAQDPLFFSKENKHLVFLSAFRSLAKVLFETPDPANSLLVDELGRPHCVDGPSHRWHDGFCLYHCHGVAIPSNWITEKDFLTINKVIGWENHDQRIVGYDFLLKR